MPLHSEELRRAARSALEIDFMDLFYCNPLMKNYDDIVRRLEKLLFHDEIKLLQHDIRFASDAFAEVLIQDYEEILSGDYSFEEEYKPTLAVMLDCLEEVRNNCISFLSNSVQERVFAAFNSFDRSFQKAVIQVKRESIKTLPCETQLRKLIGTERYLANNLFPRSTMLSHLGDINSLEAIYLNLTKNR